MAQLWRWLFVLCVGIVGMCLSACGTSNIVLKGVVTDVYTGKPVAGAKATLASVELTTDANGVYATNRWNKNHTLKLTAPGYELTHVPLNVDSQFEKTSDTEVVLRTALRPNMLQGTVTDESTSKPLANAQVVAKVWGSAGETTMAMTTTTDAEGRYMLSNLPEQFALQVTAQDYKPSQKNLKRTTVQNIALRPDILKGVITDQYRNTPIVGAHIKVGMVTTRTISDGTYLIKGVPEQATIVVVTAEGYASLTMPFKQDMTVLDVALRPDTFQATLLDATNKQPVPWATIIATDSLTGTAHTLTRIDGQTDGTFTLKDLPEKGYVQILAPGYRKRVLEIQPGHLSEHINLEPLYVKAIYAKTSTAAQPKFLRYFFDMIDQTELNALVIDLKSDNIADLGLIYYQSHVPIIKELGTSADLMDIRAILKEARKRNIYTIARIHVFSHDNLLAEKKPEWAARDASGCKPNENRKCNGDIFYADWDIAWLDSWNRNVWDYNIQLGVEAAQLGFDEIQFDYIRFASDAKNIEHMVLSKPTDPKNNPEAMYENIATLMKHAHDAFNRVGAFFSVDVFGYANWLPQPAIGQNVSLMARYADYICPMVYPSHYAINELGFENVAAHPYEIVHESLKRGEAMIHDKYAKQRPWLQDFTLLWVPDDQIVTYGPKEVRAQIDATEAFTRSVGWTLWNSDNKYTFDALKPAP